MGRIIINETDNKQVIVLNSDAEGVTGGYFDANMTWTDMGGPKPKKYKLHPRTTLGSGLILLEYGQSYDFAPAAGYNNPVIDRISFVGGTSRAVQIECYNESLASPGNKQLLAADGTLVDPAYADSVFEFVADERFLTNPSLVALFEEVFIEVTEE